MANVKISQLPAAVSLIPNADVAPIVHAGTTYKATPNQIVQAVLPSPGPIGSSTPSTAVFTTLTATGTTTLATTLTGLLKATSGVVSVAVANTDYLPATTGSAIQKANGSGGLTNAVSGTDYAPATSGTSILYGNGSGGFSNVTVGSGLSFAGGILTSLVAGGTVTTVSVVSANGFAGTVANASSTPAITLSTTVTGLLKGNGTAISAATAGTDYQAAITATGILKGAGAGSVSAAVSGTDYAPATSGTAILKGNGSGGFSSATSGTDYAPATSGTSILKGDGAGGFSSATSGTDYAPATSGSSILYGNGAGGFSNVTVGSGLTFAGGTLASVSGGGGTVTSVSGTGTVNGLTLTGTVTTSGSLTLGGTLDLSAPPAIGGTTPAAITGTTVTANTKFVSSYFDASGSGGGSLRTSGGTACLQWGGGGGTNLTLDGAFNMNPVNASISIAPTGTGTLTVNPATAGTIDNVAIGGTTAASGKFTTLTATGTTTLATSLTGLLKAASGVVSTATAGTDYAPATSGTSILYGNGSGGFSNVTIGSNLTFVGGTLSATGGSMVYPGAGIAVSTGSAWGTSKATPTGDVVGTSDTQTLTNKTLTNPVINGFTGDTSVINIGSGQIYKDASGRLGIGTTSPVTTGGSLFEISNNVNCLATITCTNDTTSILDFRTNGVDRLEIQSSSNWGAYFLVRSNQDMRFGTNNTERARIDSSGNLLVGTTSVSGKITAYQSTSDGSTGLTIVKSSTTNTSAQWFVAFLINAGVTGSGYIGANGGSAAAFGAYSDSRLKENITALPNQLANICALKPSEFDYKDGSGHQIGFIAQEMQEVYPDVVGEGEDGMLTITGWSKTEARLVKAIQELSAELNELKAKVNA